MFKMLRKFNVIATDQDNVSFALPATRLTDPTVMKDLLETYAIYIKALDLHAAAAYFCSNLGSAAVGLQYAISHYDRAFVMTLDKMTVQLVPGDRKSSLFFKLNDWSEVQVPAASDARGDWMAAAMKDFYRNTVRPLIEAVSAASGMETVYLWGLLPTRFNYYTGEWMEAASADDVRRTKIASDYAVLVNGLPPDTFGLSRNPFDVKVRWLEDLNDPCKQVRMKNVCCMYYRTEGGQSCYTCPRLKEEERAERRAAARGQLLTTT